MSTIKPKIDIDAVHRELRSMLKGTNYLILLEDKSEKELYVFTNFGKDKAKKALNDVSESLVDKTAIESNINGIDYDNKNLKDEC